ncbi:MAG TPA: hypothetical protein ENI36_03290 [Thermoplasmatales archaeon]|nr:MAG: hypothetical protein DRP42_02810 [Mycoplasmatota bacterium]HEC72609.1 hypothetical protein [Thermoplasmatales archaeon]
MPCNNSRCKGSINQGDHSPMFGYGTKGSYLEHGCNTCAREFEDKYPEFGMCWPWSNNFKRNKSLQNRLIDDIQMRWRKDKEDLAVRRDRLSHLLERQTT